MMSRGTAAPSWVRRYPVSIGCEIKVLISMISPRLARGGTLMRGLATATPPRDRPRGSPRRSRSWTRTSRRASGRSRPRSGVGEADARRHARAAGARSQAEARDVWLWILLVEDVQRLDVVSGRHRALGADRARHRVAGLG